MNLLQAEELIRDLQTRVVQLEQMKLDRNHPHKELYVENCTICGLDLAYDDVNTCSEVMCKNGKTSTNNFKVASKILESKQK